MHFDPHSSPLLVSFVLIFVAELGDKTLLTIVLLAARHHALPVLLGSWAAFVVQGAIALTLGSVLSLLPALWVRVLTACVFAFFGIKLLFGKDDAASAEEPKVLSHRQVAVSAFAMVTAAEWGDASQIGTAALVAHLGAPFQVAIGATLGLWAGAVLAVLAGRLIRGRIPTVWLRRVAGALFCIFAVISLVRGA